MPLWKRNLYTIWVAELTAIVGFTVILPFLPYYVQELGVTDLKAVEFWSGLLFALHALTMALFAPLWGLLADRYGRKLMVERAMFGGAVVMGAMGLVHSVEQLALLRALQGCLTGTVAAAAALVATTVPREKAGYGMGLLQMAVYIGASAGPLLGGLVADLWGYRAAFGVTSVLLFLAGFMVLLLVREDFQPVRGEAREDFRLGLKELFHHKALLSLFGVRGIMRFGMRVPEPTLPLFVQSLLPGLKRVASVTGTITGIRALSGALGAVLLGRAGDRIGHRLILLACAVSVTVLYASQALVNSPGQLLILQALTGVAWGGLLASFSALLARMAPEGRQGMIYGIDACIVSVANAAGPMTGATIAATMGLRFTFLGAAGAFVLVSLGLARVFVRPARA